MNSEGCAGVLLRELQNHLTTLENLPMAKHKRRMTRSATIATGIINTVGAIPPRASPTSEKRLSA